MASTSIREDRFSPVESATHEVRMLAALELWPLKWRALNTKSRSCG